MMLSYFKDDEHGGFFDTAVDHETLIQRPKDVQDNATPSGNSVAALVLLRLSLYTGAGHYWEVAEQTVSALYGPMLQYPSAFGQWLVAASFIVAEPQEVAIVAEPDSAEAAALLAVVFANYNPNLVTAVGKNGAVVPLLAQREQIDGKATAYLCRRFVCQQPVTQASALAAQLAN
jgi:uncharacterized protein YyaL (SSP411 family)